MEYTEFLKRKIKLAPTFGFESPLPLNGTLYPHQKDIVSFCIKAGRAAVFGQFGLGKTAMQIELMAHVCRHTQKPVLICLPLAVKQEFLKDARRMDYPPLHYVKDQSEVTG